MALLWQQDDAVISEHHYWKICLNAETNGASKARILIILVLSHYPFLSPLQQTNKQNIKITIKPTRILGDDAQNAVYESHKHLLF